MKITENTIEKIIEHHVGHAPQYVAELQKTSFNNFVYEAHVNNERYIVRISDQQTKLQYFLKEQWAVARAREKKVPVPEILEVGNEASAFPYMITRKVEGVVGTKANDRMKVIWHMGNYTALINNIPTSGFGHVFDWSGNTLSRKETWKDYLDRELEIWKNYEIFKKSRVLNESNLKKLKKHLSEMENWSVKTHLNHGDMRLKNIILDEKEKIAVILDWENCMSQYAPFWDLAIALHDLNIDEREMFLEGYGMSGKEFMRILPSIKVINIINYAPFVTMAQNTKNKEWLDRLRVRLNGGFDLYSL